MGNSLVFKFEYVMFMMLYFLIQIWLWYYETRYATLL